MANDSTGENFRLRSASLNGACAGEARQIAKRSKYDPCAGHSGHDDRGSGSGRHELYFPAALARPNDPAKVVT